MQCCEHIPLLHPLALCTIEQHEARQHAKAHEARPQARSVTTSNRSFISAIGERMKNDSSSNITFHLSLPADHRPLLDWHLFDLRPDRSCERERKDFSLEPIPTSPPNRRTSITARLRYTRTASLDSIETLRIAKVSSSDALFVFSPCLVLFCLKLAQPPPSHTLSTRHLERAS